MEKGNVNIIERQHYLIKVARFGYGKDYAVYGVKFYNENYIAYDPQTKVLYYVINNPEENIFNITPLYNPDGTLRVYKEEEWKEYPKITIEETLY